MATPNPPAGVSISDVVGWWGGILATITAGWEWYKWKTSGPKFRLHAAPDMQMAQGGQLEDQKYIVVTVTNIGDARSTLTHLLIYHYKTKADLRKKKPEDRMIPKLMFEGQLPHPLDPGDQWTTVIPQHERLEKMLIEGFLTVVVWERGKEHETPVKLIRPAPEPAKA